MTNSKWLSAMVVLIQVAIFSLALLSHQLDNHNNDVPSINIPYVISKAAGTALHINLILLMSLNCHFLLWLFRNTFGRFSRLGDSRTAQNLNYNSMLAFATIHMGSQWAIFAQLSVRHGLGLKGFALSTFVAGVGWSGHIMFHMLILKVAFTALLSRATGPWLMAWGENAFSVTFLALWAAHEAFCVPDRNLDSFTTGSDVFWKFWIAGAMVYMVERIVLGVRSKHKVRNPTSY